ncbi:MAG: hypothetical protein K8T25_18920 [Planctomycetia bacterium]|nr:hypothetical protein [Planctomycetia bacterium]
MKSHLNPYAPPAVTEEDVAFSGGAAEIRRRHLRRERSLQTLGQLYWLAGVFAGIVALILFVAILFSPWNAAQLGAQLLNIVEFIGLVAVATGFITLGRGLAALDRRVRYPALALSVLWLVVTGILTSYFLPVVVFPVLNLYTIFILTGRPARTIFSARYAKILAQTPHIKYGNSSGRWDL